jgi:hypothetical protein
MDHIKMGLNKKNLLKKIPQKTQNFFPPKKHKNGPTVSPLKKYTKYYKKDPGKFCQLWGFFFVFFGIFLNCFFGGILNYLRAFL